MSEAAAVVRKTWRPGSSRRATPEHEPDPVVNRRRLLDPLCQRLDAGDPEEEDWSGVQLCRAGREGDQGPGGAGPDPVPRHSAGLHRRLDLPQSPGPHPGDRPGCPAQETVPVPSPVERGRGRDQVRPSARLQRSPAPHPPPGAERPRQAGPAPGEGAGHGGTAARLHRDPHRQRRVRPLQPVIRPDHPARPPRRDLRLEHPVRVSGKERNSHSARRTPRLARIVQRCQALPGEDLFQYLDDQGVGQTIGSGDVTTTCGLSGRGIHGQGFPYLVRHQAGDSGLERLGPGAPSDRQKQISCGPSIAWPTSSTTPAPCAASTTFTPPCWMPIPAVPCSKPSRMERGRRHRLQWPSMMLRSQGCCERLCSEQPAPASPQQLSPS